MVNIRINKTFGKYIAGQLVQVETDHEGTPTDQYWRRRLKDAQTDACCEVMQEAQPVKTKQTRKSRTSEEG